MGAIYTVIPSNPSIYIITPQNQFILAPWQYPDNTSTHNELIDYEMGGIAIQDPSHGLQYQVWRGWVDGSNVYLQPQDLSAPPTLIFIESGIEELAISFDQNMRWVAAIRKGDNSAQLRWYDSAVENYVTTPYAGLQSVRLTHDDKRDLQVTSRNSDIIFTYIRAGAVRWRIQRDRYLIEYTKTGIPITPHSRISHFGMSTKNRLQWRIGPRHLNT